ncbi:hypothetical protein LTR53_004835 [Teratosphaeriaceae sp. CCFEE 6253]|nr:hypothetical protein LTR53_004835 [Teratosphaeriaceae sp. CCFEE 6253]
MPDVGNITKVGWLYEGNYNQWEQRMDSILVITGHCHRTAVIPEIFTSTGVMPEGYCCGRDGHRRLLRSIQSQVTPAFWQRIPKSDRSDVIRLLAKLKAHARPFRLLDLGAETRGRIYELLFDEGERYWLTTRGTLALPCRKREDGLVSAVRGWIGGELQDAVTHLRELQVFMLSPHDRERGVRLLLHPLSGLSVTLRGAWDADWQALVTSHVAAIEDTRSLLYLQGEAIIMAIMTRPDLWREQAMRAPVRRPELDQNERVITDSRATAS